MPSLYAYIWNSKSVAGLGCSVVELGCGNNLR